jgi:CTD nuclear envelope phosphatase 1
MKEYADPVIDWLDAGQGILARRFFREVCTSPYWKHARVSSE